MAKVSVIIPNYNYSRYLDDRMESVLNQTFQDFEIIILDDKSTDGSVGVIEKYRSHPKVSKIVLNERNTGKPCIQWHKGWELAEGEYVWIAEADDLAAPAFLETAVKCLDEEKEASIFFCGSWQNNEEGDFCVDNFARRSVPKFRSEAGRGYWLFDGKFYRENYLVYGNTIYNASGAVFRRKAADEADWKYACGCFSIGDWALWSRLTYKGKVMIYEERLNCFRLHHDNATKRFTKDVRNFIDMLYIIRDNSEGLSLWKRMVVVGRLKSVVINRQLDRAGRREMDKEMEKIYGKDFLCRARIVCFLNKMLIATPWHISQTADHRKRPKTGN